MEPVGPKHRIGGYRIIAAIGIGNSSTVYRAINESTGEEVAIKLLADNYSRLPETRNRFADEADLLSAIDSPAVATIYEVGENDNQQPFLVLELADRGSLRRRLDELREDGRRVSREQLLLLVDHLAEGLGTLHRAGVIHRDVSPNNVLIRSTPRAGSSPLPSVADQAASLLRSDEQFLLVDLGFAKDTLYASGLTAGGGTRGFAAPEQREDITIVDHRADIYSATALVEWVAADSDIGDSEHAEQFDAFVDIGLADEPGDRFESMQEWLEAARVSLTTQIPVAATSDDWVSGSDDIRLDQSRLSRTKRITSGRTVLIALLLSALGLIGGYRLATSPRGDEVSTSVTEAGETTMPESDSSQTATPAETTLALETPRSDSNGSSTAESTSESSTTEPLPDQPAVTDSTVGDSTVQSAEEGSTSTESSSTTTVQTVETTTPGGSASTSTVGSTATITIPPAYLCTNSRGTLTWTDPPEGTVGQDIIRSDGQVTFRGADARSWTDPDPGAFTYQLKAKIRSNVLSLADCIAVDGNDVPETSSSQDSGWRLLAVSNSSPEGFAINLSGRERTWVNADCRSRIIEEARLELERLAWSEIRRLGPTDRQLSCERLLAEIS